MPKKLLMGNEALAHAALEAGVSVVAGYPGTPSSELIESVARMRAAGKAEGVYVEWSANEKAALELAYGASLAGARALFTCKQVGLNVASDALMSLNYLGVRGGLVLFVADDPGPISSQTEQDTRKFAQFAKVPVFDPATPEQGAEMMKAAFDLSEEFGVPVIVRPTTRIDHASTFFEVQGETKAKPAMPGGFVRDPQKWVIFPKLSNEAHGKILSTLSDIARETAYAPQYNRFNPILENVSPEGMPEMQPKVGIITGGVTTQYAREALELLAREAHGWNLNMPRYRLMQVGTPYPFPTRAAKRFLNGLEHVLVLEELDPVIEEELLKAAGDSFLSAHVHGKLTGEAPVKGENSTELMAKSIADFFDSYASKYIRRSASVSSASVKFAELVENAIGDQALLHYDGELPSRPPVLCAGCPHRGSFYAVKCALSRIGMHREDAVFCGDIGCYTLGNAKPLDAADTCLCMGAGITMAQGMNIVEPEKKHIAFVGDSTFFASALTGIANAVYNRHDITIAILDNSTTAMTGSQPHPGTGATLMGGADAPSNPIDIEGVLEALGVEFIVNADPLNHAQAEEVSAAALRFQGPSAIIFRSPCVWISPFSVPAEVDMGQCTGCKRCIADIGCPAISFSVDARGPKSGTRGQAVIDPSQCNGCGLCVQVCPFGAIFVPSALQLAEREESAMLASSHADGSMRNAGSARMDAEASERPGVEDIGDDIAREEDRSEPAEEPSQMNVSSGAHARSVSRAHASSRMRAKPHMRSDRSSEQAGVHDRDELSADALADAASEESAPGHRSGKHSVQRGGAGAHAARHGHASKSAPAFEDDLGEPAGDQADSRSSQTPSHDAVEPRDAIDAVGAVENDDALPETPSDEGHRAYDLSERDFSAEPLRVYGGSLEIIIETDDADDADSREEGRR